VQQGVTFGAKHDFCNFQPLCTKFGAPDPQFLYSVIYFFGPLMFQQKLSMQVSPLWSLQGSVLVRKNVSPKRRETKPEVKSRRI